MNLYDTLCQFRHNYSSVAKVNFKGTAKFQVNKFILCYINLASPNLTNNLAGKFVQDPNLSH